MPKKLIIIFIVSIGLGLLILQGLAEETTTPKSPDLPTRIESLIKQLGSEDWNAREAANQELESIGEAAEPFLKTALDNPDSEIVLRVKSLLQNIEIIRYGKIVFVRGQDIWTMDANGQNQTKLFAGISIGQKLELIDNVEFLYAPQWSPDGRKIMFVAKQTGNDDIYVMDSDGQNRVNLTNHPADDGAPVWSPDGKYIAFMSRRHTNWDIYRMDADGQNVIRLTKHNAQDELPAWSNDGQQIAFISTRDRNVEIYTMNMNGRTRKRLTNTPAQEILCSWSPDDQKMIYLSSTQHNQWVVYMMSADGQNKTPLIDGEMVGYNPAWSPDGKQIAYTLKDGAKFGTFLMDGQGKNRIRLTSNKDYEEFPVWSYDGKWLLIASGPVGGFYDLYRLAIDQEQNESSKLQRLTFEGGYLASWQPRTK